MAKVTLSPFLTLITGSVGNATFQKGIGGLSLRTKPIPRRSVSSSQYNSRLYLRQCQQAWLSLSTSQRSLWANFAMLKNQPLKKNRNVSLSVYNLFLKYNLLRLHAGWPLLLDITMDYVIDLLVDVVLTRTVSNLIIHMETDPLAPTSFFLLKLTSISRLSNFRYDKSIRVISLTPPFYDIQDITDTYLSIFGILPEIGDVVYSEIILGSLDSPALSSVYSNPLIVAPI